MPIFQEIGPIEGLYEMVALNTVTQRLFKLAVMGSGGVGKSTLVARLITGSFIEKPVTVGFNVETWNISSDSSTVIKIACFDFGGQKQFRFFQGSLVAGTKAVILVFDCTAPETLQQISEWLDLIEFIPSERKILVGTKSDISPDFNESLLDEWSQKYCIEHIIVSSKTGKNFGLLEQKILMMVSQ